jgi:hydrogenase maturation protease
MRTLVVGLGNPILGDDAVGLRLARDFVRGRPATLERAPAGDGWSGVDALRRGDNAVDVIEDCPAYGLDVLELLAGYDRLVLFDAIVSGGATPGSWCRFTATALQPTRHLRNVHDANLATALELGRRLGLRLPPDHEVHVFAVEIVHGDTFSSILSPGLEAAYPDLAFEILRDVEELLSASSS